LRKLAWSAARRDVVRLLPRRTEMLDAIMIGIGVVFFIAMAGYVALCERL
jgi:hypothetical protein